jgi:hypothetical protein
MDGFTTQVLRRASLGVATLSLFQYVAQPSFLQELYQKHRGRCYQRELDFPLLANLAADALTQHRGSVNQAYQRADEGRLMPASRQAAYGKFRRMPIDLSCAFLAQTTTHLQELLPQTPVWPAPRSAQSLVPVVIDGKKIKNVAKALSAARGVSGALLGGKILLALDPVASLALAMNAHPDGEANDVPLVAGLLPQVRERIPAALLWIADRQFCNLVSLRQMLQRQQPQDHFLVRYAASIKFCRDKTHKSKGGRDGRGRRYVQEWGWLGVEGNPRRLYVRRITIRRPGKSDLAVVSDLLSGKLFPAIDLLELYLKRGGIEHVFQQITEVFHLEHLIGCTPEAGIFQAAFCLVIYNLMQVIRGQLAELRKRRAAEISLENVFYDAHRDLVAMGQMLDLGSVSRRLPCPAGPRAMRQQLRRLLKEQWHKWWLKGPPKKSGSSRPKAKGESGAHTSIYRLLQARQARKRRPRHARRRVRLRHR